MVALLGGMCRVTRGGIMSWNIGHVWRHTEFSRAILSCLIEYVSVGPRLSHRSELLRGVLGVKPGTDTGVLKYVHLFGWWYSSVERRRPGYGCG